MPARLVSDNGAHVVIRPLVYVSEAEARAYAREYELPIVGCCCPSCGDLSLQRQRVKRLLLDLELAPVAGLPELGKKQSHRPKSHRLAQSMIILLGNRI